MDSYYITLTFIVQKVKNTASQMNGERELPRLDIDPEADSAYLRLNDREVHHSTSIRDDILVNFDANNEAVGVELIGFGLEPEENPEEVATQFRPSTRLSKRGWLIFGASCISTVAGFGITTTIGYHEYAKLGIGLVPWVAGLSGIAYTAKKAKLW